VKTHRVQSHYQTESCWLVFFFYNLWIFNHSQVTAHRCTKSPGASRSAPSARRDSLRWPPLRRARSAWRTPHLKPGRTVIFWLIYVFVCLYIYIYTYIYIYIVCVYVCLYVCMSVCLYVCMSVCLCMHACLYMRTLCVCVSTVCICVCIYIYIQHTVHTADISRSTKNSKIGPGLVELTKILQLCPELFALAAQRPRP